MHLPERLFHGPLARIAGLAALLLVVTSLVWIGGRLARLAPASSSRVLRASPILVQLVPAFIAAGLAALAMRWIGLKAWGGPTALWLAGLCFASAALNSYIMATFRLGILDDRLVISQPPMPKRTVRLSDIRSWRADERRQLVIELRDQRRVRLSPVGWQGLEQVALWLQQHGMPGPADPAPRSI